MFHHVCFIRVDHRWKEVLVVHVCKLLPDKLTTVDHGRHMAKGSISKL